MPSIQAKVDGKAKVVKKMVWRIRENQRKFMHIWVVVLKIFCLFSPLFGEDSHFDSYFLDGLKPPTRCTLNFERLFF